MRCADLLFCCVAMECRFRLCEGIAAAAAAAAVRENQVEDDLTPQRLTPPATSGMLRTLTHSIFF
jgi:hypothetical protein